MVQDTKTNRTIQEGRNVKRFREMLGIKQDTLATMLHEDWTQVNISRIEQKETIDAPLLQQISAALKIPVEAIQDFDEEQAVNIIANTFNIDKDAYIGNFAQHLISIQLKNLKSSMKKRLRCMRGC